MGQVGDVQVGIDGLAPPGELDENGFVGAVSLLSLETGDPAPESFGAIGGSPLRNLGIERSQLALVEPDGDLGGGHAVSLAESSSNWYAYRGRSVVTTGWRHRPTDGPHQLGQPPGRDPVGLLWRTPPGAPTVPRNREKLYPNAEEFPPENWP